MIILSSWLLAEIITHIKMGGSLKAMGAYDKEVIKAATGEQRQGRYDVLHGRHLR